MIRMRAGDQLLFGLSEENLRRLKKGSPIAFDLAPLGVPGLSVVIYYGATEESMKQDLERQGIAIRGDHTPTQ